VSQQLQSNNIKYAVKTQLSIPTVMYPVEKNGFGQQDFWYLPVSIDYWEKSRFVFEWEHHCI